MVFSSSRRYHEYILLVLHDIFSQADTEFLQLDNIAAENMQYKEPTRKYLQTATLYEYYRCDS